MDTGRLSSRTNVYGIGATLYCLFTLEDHPEQPLWLGGQPSSHKLNEMQLTLDAAESDGEGDGKSENDDEEAHTVERQNSEDQESDTKADDCDFLPTNFREEEPEDPFQQKRDKHVRSYSVELRRLIMWCLRENPAARRSVDALQRYISGLVSDRDYDSDDSDFDQSKKILRDVSGMRTGLAEDEVAARRALEYQQDRYKTGMSREDLPRRSRASVQDGDDCKLRSEA